MSRENDDYDGAQCLDMDHINPFSISGRKSKHSGHLDIVALLTSDDSDSEADFQLLLEGKVNL